MAQKHADYIKGEMLSREIVAPAEFGQREGVEVESAKVDGHPVTMGVKRVGA